MANVVFDLTELNCCLSLPSKRRCNHRSSILFGFTASADSIDLRGWSGAKPLKSYFTGFMYSLDASLREKM